MRCAGSTDSHRVRIRTWPSAGRGIGASFQTNSSPVNFPAGRAFRSHWRFLPSVMGCPPKRTEHQPCPRSASAATVASGPRRVVDVGDWEPAIALALPFDPSDSRKIHVGECREVAALGGVGERLLAGGRSRLLVDIEGDGDRGIGELGVGRMGGVAPEKQLLAAGLEAGGGMTGGGAV